MNLLRNGLVLVVAVAALLPGRLAARSDLSGIHAIVERVVLEPAAGTPARIQVWGAFRVGRGYTAEFGRGYLYFGLPPQSFTCTTCPPASEGVQVALREWTDLKAVAGTGQAVGFGVRTYEHRIRPAGAPPTSPEPYPLGIGMFKLGPTHPYLAELKKLLP